MSRDASEREWAARLSAQLKSLTEVAESLTYRLLELEERHADLLETLQDRLHDTEARLGRLEGLLRTDEQLASLSLLTVNPPLRALSRSSARPPRDNSDRSDEGPFPGEGSAPSLAS